MLFPSSSSSLPSSCWTECGRDGWNSSGPSGPQGGFEDGAHRHETTSWKGLSLREHGGAGAPCQHQTEGLWTSILGGKNCLSCFNHCCSDSLLVTAKANLIFRVKLSPQEETPSSFISLLVHLYTSSPAPQTILPSPSANVRTLTGSTLLSSHTQKTISKAVAWCHGHQLVQPALL